MLFNSLTYAFFLPCVFIFYWILPHKYRWPLLLIASYYFYMSWNIKYVFLILTTTLVSYFCALLIEKHQKYKKIAIILSLFVSIGILYVFKYYNFTVQLLERITPLSLKRLDFLLPVGISFYTFQSLSYVIDVYKGNVKAERNFGVYATFVSFFPQLVAGPIERTKNLMPQITSIKCFDYNAATYGFRLIVWGLYKKMVIADNLALYVDKVYENIDSYHGFSLLLATLFFSIQIYCDFSGYSDIARGSAKLLNINIMENFKSPYYSTSLKEFWSRWHISLSTWFRDYLYIPLGGNRVSKTRNIFNNLVTFFVSGLWHGASLTFVAWGGLYGLGQVCENAFSIRKQEKHNLYWAIRVLFVFSFVTMGWVCFRAKRIKDALFIYQNIFLGLNNICNYFSEGLTALGLNRSINLKLFFVYFLPLALYDYFSLNVDINEYIGKKPLVVRYAYVFIISCMILLYGCFGQSSFVYFQF